MKNSWEVFNLVTEHLFDRLLLQYLCSIRSTSIIKKHSEDLQVASCSAEGTPAA